MLLQVIKRAKVQPPSVCVRDRVWVCLCVVAPRCCVIAPWFKFSGIPWRWGRLRAVEAFRSPAHSLLKSLLFICTDHLSDFSCVCFSKEPCLRGGISLYAAHMQMKPPKRWTLPFSAPRDVSHKLPTFSRPVPNGPGPDAALMYMGSLSVWLQRFTADLSELLIHHHFCRGGPLLTRVSHKYQWRAVSTGSSITRLSLITSPRAAQGLRTKFAVWFDSKRRCRLSFLFGELNTPPASHGKSRNQPRQRKRISVLMEDDQPTSVCSSEDTKVALLLVKPSAVLTLHRSFYVQAVMHRPNLDKSSGTGVLVQPPSGADTSENGSVLIPAAVELSGYFELLMLSAGH